MPAEPGGQAAPSGCGTRTTMKLKRWTARLVGGAVALSAFGGCKQQLFLEPGDYQQARTQGLPKSLEPQPYEPIMPPVVEPGAGPATVMDPPRPPRYMTLKE